MGSCIVSEPRASIGIDLPRFERQLAWVVTQDAYGSSKKIAVVNCGSSMVN